MKKPFLASLSLIIACTVVIVSCNKDGTISKTLSQGKFSGTTKVTASRLPNGNYSCGDNLTGTFTTPNAYYQYPSYTLDFSGSSNGTLIQVHCIEQQVPNRFSITDASGNLITTGWIGYANYSGPWGTTLQNTPNKDLSFSKSGTGIYTLKVETSTPKDSTDAWSASISCTPPPIVNDCPTPPPPGCNCGASFSGQHLDPAYFTYADRIIDFSCKPAGQNVWVTCYPQDVPDQFDVLDPSGVTVATSGWTGSANYLGPWGSSLYKPSATLNFTRSTSFTYYRLRVHTVRDSRYETRSDTWQATVGCGP